MNKILALVGLGLVLSIAIGALFALPVMWLWNGCLVGAISGVNEVTYLQSWGLFILCSLLFKATVTNKE